MRLRILSAVVAAAGLAVIAAGCGDSKVAGSGETATSSTTASTASTATSATSTTSTAEITACLDEKDQPKAGDKPSFSKAEQVLKPGAATLVMKTSCGTLNIELDQKAGGPIPNSIAFLAGKGFFDGLTFHRVVPDFVLQGGDPRGDGTGGPGYQVVGAVPAGYQYKIGDVAMAKTQADPPGTSGSQFFVVSSINGGLGLTQQPVYGILGHATDAASLATIKRIAALAVTDGPPSKPVWIISATVSQ